VQYPSDIDESLKQNLQTVSKIKIDFNFTSCQEGEVFSLDGKSCEVCPSGTYAKLVGNKSKKDCVQCIADGVCKSGRIWPANGTRPAKSATDLFIKCPRRQACL
jgi:hypothetical protein